MNPIPLPRLAVLLLPGFFAISCASSSNLPVYDTSQTGQIITQQRGEVIAVRDVIIAPPSNTAINGGPGRQIGSAVGRSVATGSPTAIASAIGGVVGGNLGANADAKRGEEITIRLDTDQVVTIVQELGKEPIMPGERVSVQSGGSSGSATTGGAARVVRDTGFYADYGKQEVK